MGKSMTATLERMPRPMKPATESIRINKELARKARIVAAALNMSMPDYVTQKLGELVEKESRDVAAGLLKKPEKK